MLYSRTDPESYITDNAFVFEDSIADDTRLDHSYPGWSGMKQKEYIFSTGVGLPEHHY